jgi:hypothetical protein
MDANTKDVEGGEVMQVNIEINDKELREEVTSIIARKLTNGWSTERNVMKRTIADAVKEVVYSEKEFIIDMVINRATTEIVKKSMPKLIDKMMD